MNKIYLIYGTEKYLANQYIKKIINENDNYEVIKYDMETINVDTAINDSMSISLFESNKIVICENCLFLTTLKSSIEHNIDSVVNYISLETSNILIFTVLSESLDKRRKIVKLLEQNSDVKIFNTLNEYELKDFIRSYVMNNNFKIEPDALNLFLEKLNSNLYVITSELDKMFLYKNDNRVIEKKDVLLVTSSFINTNIFDFISAIIKNNVELSLRLYDDLLLYNEEEIKLIIILSNEFRLIYQVKELTSMGYSESDIARKLNVHPYRVKLSKNVDITVKDALKYLKKLSDLDIMIKMGNIDKKEGFLKFILGVWIFIFFYINQSLYLIW